jgi:oxygen-independent coproporphyrinogen-3 oxidase
VYCDFYSLENMEHKDVFVSILKKEIAAGAEKYRQFLRPATSIFFGGGTPSLLTPEQIASIMNQVKVHLPVHPDAEVTMECNPGTITKESLIGYRKSGVNRLSFGIQSFNQDELDFLHRIHSPEEGKQAVKLAREAGFDNVNIDVIFALPNQSIESWQNTLEQAIALQTEHISAYSLIFEEKTPLFSMLQKGLVKPQDEDKDAAIYALTIDMLQSAGYEQYEVSNFAKPHLRCNHNRTYWQAKEYLAFGPSAHGYVNNIRYWNYRNLKRYFEAVQKTGIGEASREELSFTNRLYESAFLGIRSEGISRNDFLQEYDIDILSIIQSALDIHAQEEFLLMEEISGDIQIRLNSKGFAICDEISLRIITALEHKMGEIWESKGYEEEEETGFDLPIL